MLRSNLPVPFNYFMLPYSLTLHHMHCCRCKAFGFSKYEVFIGCVFHCAAHNYGRRYK